MGGGVGVRPPPPHTLWGSGVELESERGGGWSEVGGCCGVQWDAVGLGICKGVGGVQWGRRDAMGFCGMQWGWGAAMGLNGVQWG